MTRISTKSASTQLFQSDSAQSTMASKIPLTPQANVDSKGTPKKPSDSNKTMSDLREQVKHLQASFDDLISSSRTSILNINNPDSSPDKATSVLTRPGSSIPPQTPSIDESEDKVSYLYTDSGTSDSHRVFACCHCAPGEVLIPESLLEDMQAKIVSMAERGRKAVQGRIEVLQQLSLAKEQHLQLATILSNTNKSFRAVESDLRKQAARAQEEKDLVEQTLSNANQNFEAADRDLRQEVLKAEKAQSLAEQLKADMLMHWNTALWEVATLKANVKKLEGQMERETNARTTAETDVASMMVALDISANAGESASAYFEQREAIILAAKQEQLERETAAKTAAENDAAVLRSQLEAANTAATFRIRILERENAKQIDARTTAEREAETLLFRVREATAQSRDYLDTNDRLNAEILELTREKEQLVAVDLTGVQSHCDRLHAAENEDANRMNALERRNAWLEERLSVYEKTMSADTVALSDDIPTPSRGQGPGWGFGSLRRLRRREAEEEESISLRGPV